MNFKNNIAQCNEARAMGYRVQFRGGLDDRWYDSTGWLAYCKADKDYRVHPDDLEAYLKQRAALNTAPDPAEDTHTEVNATSVETPDDSLEVLAKMLPLLGSLPGVTADITITLHIKV